MATKSKIKLDKCAYDYSVFRWGQLTELPVATIVSKLSAGEMVPSTATKKTKKEIDKLLQKISEFVPRVRLSASDGREIRTMNAQWYHHLHHLKKVLLKKQKVVYLSKAVNDILKQREVKGVRCTNGILTTYLHHQSFVNGKILYRNLDPIKVADYIEQYAGSFWEKLNKDGETIEVSLTTKFTTTSTTKATHKKPLLSTKDRAMSLLLFPYSISTPSDSNFTVAVMNDLSIIEQFLEWSKAQREIDYTPEYRQVYEQYRAKLMTVPTPKEVVLPASDIKNNPTRLSDIESNKAAIMKLLLKKAGNNQLDHSIINETQNLQSIEKMASHPNFQVLFAKLQDHSKDVVYTSHVLQYLRNLLNNSPV